MKVALKNEDHQTMTVKKINIVVGGRFHAAQLYEALTSAGHDVKIYSSSPKRYYKNIPADRLVFIPKIVQIIQKLSKRRMPRKMHELNALAFDWLISKSMRKADILWGFNGDSLYCGIATQASGGLYIVDRACPHFVTQEKLLANEAKKLDYPYAHFSQRMRDRFVREYEVADAIVVPSIYSMKSFSEHELPDAKIHIIPLDANAPRPGAISSRDCLGDGVAGEKQTDFRIGIVGGSFLRKGIIYLLRAVKALNKPDIVLYLRANEANVTMHAEAHALCDELNVVFVPYVEDINEFYRSLDVFVLPSMDEGFGMVVYEALMNGTPVIASTNVGSIDGLMPDKEMLIFRAGDDVELARAIERLYLDDEYRLSVGKAGQAHYDQKMSGGSLYKGNLEQLISQLTLESC